jgi:hypothetical protein
MRIAQIAPLAESVPSQRGVRGQGRPAESRSPRRDSADGQRAAGQPYRHLRLELETPSPSFNENAIPRSSAVYRGAIALVGKSSRSQNGSDRRRLYGRTTTVAR